MVAITWSKEECDKLIELKLQSPKLSNKEIAEIMVRTFDKDYSKNACRIKGNRLVRGMPKPNKVNTTINQDGSQTSSTIIAMTSEQSKSPEYVLKAHGFNSDEWKLKHVTNNFWQQGSVEHGTKDLYQSKIIVEPIVNDIDYQALIERLESHVEPFKPTKSIVTSGTHNYLCIPLFDTHFKGFGECYQDSLERTMNVIRSKSYDKVNLILGGDILHVDSLSNKTTRGTQLETVNFAESVTEAENYVEQILMLLLTSSETIHVTSCIGNHDSVTGYMFARIMKAFFESFENITWDIALKTRHATMLGKNFIACSHGDKNLKRTLEVLPGEFALQWSQATNRELITGHLHNEKVDTHSFITHRQVSTRVPADKWHEDEGFIGASKHFTILHYDEESVTGIDYV